MNITPLLILFIIVPILALALLALNVLLAVHHPDEAKVSAYECGMPPLLGQTRSTFQVHFFIVGLLFLIFDLEILLLFPIGVTLYQVSSFGFSIAIVFFIVLTIGFVLEIGSGAISLNNLDVLNNKKNPNSNPQPQQFSPSRINIIKNLTALSAFEEKRSLKSNLNFRAINEF
jgi:NADH-ubiquinone oxidoreductase chain 3